MGDAVAEDAILALHFLQVGDGAGRLHPVEDGLDGSHALTIAAHGVHGELVEVAELLLHRTLRVVLLEQLGEDAVDALVVVLLQLVEATEARIGCGQGVGLLPSTRRKLVEILGGIGAPVEVRLDDTCLALGHAGQRS